MKFNVWQCDGRDCEAEVEADSDEGRPMGWKVITLQMSNGSPPSRDAPKPRKGYLTLCPACACREVLLVDPEALTKALREALTPPPPARLEHRIPDFRRAIYGSRSDKED